jgi:hypothetical protein
MRVTTPYINSLQLILPPGTAFNLKLTLQLQKILTKTKSVQKKKNKYENSLFEIYQ